MALDSEVRSTPAITASALLTHGGTPRLPGSLELDILQRHREFHALLSNNLLQ